MVVVEVKLVVVEVEVATKRVEEERDETVVGSMNIRKIKDNTKPYLS